MIDSVKMCYKKHFKKVKLHLTGALQKFCDYCF